MSFYELELLYWLIVWCTVNSRNCVTKVNITCEHFCWVFWKIFFYIKNWFWYLNNLNTFIHVFLLLLLWLFKDEYCNKSPVWQSHLSLFYMIVFKSHNSDTCSTWQFKDEIVLIVICILQVINTHMIIGTLN